MRLPAIDGWRLAAQRLRCRYVPSTLILLYHRIADVQPDPWSLCVTPRHFAEQLETLQQYSRPMQLRQLIRALADGYLPRRSVVITFDDGYADNLHHAKPTLERYEILAMAAQRDEVERSKVCLEEVLGHPITSFSYPYGKRCDYTQDTVTIVQQAGFACACSNFAGVVRRGTDRFQLPRVNVQDCDGEAFARQLWSWFGA